MRGHELIPQPQPSFSDMSRHLVVGFTSRTDAARAAVEAILEHHHLTSVVWVEGVVAGQPTDLLELSATPPPELFDELRAESSVRFTERNGTLRSLVVPPPDDPDYRYQWAMDRVAAEPAWERASTIPNPSPVRVAIVDSGIQARQNGAQWVTHPDLVGMLDAGVNLSQEQDEDGHGTLLAGTVAAVTDNAKGVASLVWPVAGSIKLLPIKFFSPAVPLTSFGAAEAISQAVTAGAQIINLSWDVGMPFAVLREALDEALAKDRLVVVAAGNDGTDNDVLPTWPASYNLANMVSVMASNRYDDKPGFSNYGGSVDLAAPGVDILSTHYYLATPAYREYSGTSAACALVTSAAALLLSLNPGLKPAEIKAHLRASVDHFPWLSNASHGRLNVNSAVRGPIQLMKPRPGDVWVKSTTADVTWTQSYSTPACPSVRVLLSRNGGPFTQIGTSVTSDGKCTVAVPNQATLNARVRVVSDLAPSMYAESGVFQIG
jgi:subtilisin family serine protease